MKFFVALLFPVFLANAQSKPKSKPIKRSQKIRVTGENKIISNGAYFKAVAGTGWHFSAPKGETIEATTNVMTYKKDERDLYIKTEGFNKIITRDFGTVAPLHNWKITGNIWYNPSGEHGDNFTDILDPAGRVIARLERLQKFPNHSIIANKKNVVTGDISYIMGKFQPFVISEKDGLVTIQYASYPPVTKPPFDPLANAALPAKLQITLSGKGEHVMDIGLLRLYFNQ